MTDPSKRWSAKLPLTLGFLAIFLLIGGVGAWSVNTEIAGAVVAPGAVEVESERQVVQHPDCGVVGEIFAVLALAALVGGGGGGGRGSGGVRRERARAGPAHRPQPLAALHPLMQEPGRGGGGCGGAPDIVGRSSRRWRRRRRARRRRARRRPLHGSWCLGLAAAPCARSKLLLRLSLRLRRRCRWTLLSSWRRYPRQLRRPQWLRGRCFGWYFVWFPVGWGEIVASPGAGWGRRVPRAGHGSWSEQRRRRNSNK